MQLSLIWMCCCQKKNIYIHGLGILSTCSMVYHIHEMKSKMKNLHVFHKSDYYLYRNGGHNSDHHSNREEARSTRWEEQKGRGTGRIPMANSDLSHTCSSVELKLSVRGSGALLR
jgi:hypothetical protein